MRTFNIQHSTFNFQGKTGAGTSNIERRTLNIEWGRSQKGSILVGLLWCVALLSLVVVGVLHTSRIDLMAGKNYSDRIQAHYLAVAGIEKAKALLYQNAHERSRTSKNHSGELYNSPDQFREVTFGRGKYRVFRRGRQDEGGGIIYGISDEESRLNVNYASSDQLTNIDRMTPDIASAILDWRGAGDTVNPGGANADYYLSLQPPYKPRHALLETVRELLLVRGVTRDLLFGKDTHENGLLPAAGGGEDDSLSGDNSSSDSDAGWAGMLTVASTEKNVNAGGQDRVNVQTADENSLTSVKGITSSMARAIVAYRGQNKFQSIADLLDVTASQNQGQGQGGNSSSSRNSSQGDASQSQSSTQDSSGGANSNAGSGNSGSSSSGGKVISQDVLMDIADDITTADAGQDLAGMININTAALEVLDCLPGVDRQLAQGIISYRQSSGFFANTAELLKVSGMTPTILKQVAPLVSARSETFRILCEGKVTSTGARQRIQVVVHVDLNDISTLCYREDDL
jgi:competence ComEA-like helix-hairpin-helix protein